MNTPSDPITEFFKQLAELAGHGIIGIVIIIVIVTAYVVLKHPPVNRKALGMFMGFCLLMLIFLAIAGVGLVKENQKVTEKNDSLKIETKQLSQVKDTLEKILQKQDLNLKAAQVTISATQINNPEELLPQIKEINVALKTVSKTKEALEDAAIKKVINDYKILEDKIDANELNKKDALYDLRENYENVNAVLIK